MNIKKSEEREEIILMTALQGNDYLFTDQFINDLGGKTEQKTREP